MKKLMLGVGLLLGGCAISSPVRQSTPPPEKTGLYNGLTPSKIRAKDETQRLTEQFKLNRDQMLRVYAAALLHAQADRKSHWEYDTREDLASQDSIRRVTVRHWEIFCVQLRGILTPTQYEQYVSNEAPSYGAGK